MRSFLAGLLLCLPLLVRAQPPLQVVSRVIEKTMPYVMGQPIQLNTQKADVLIKGWSRPTVSVQLKLQAKHADRSVAEREVAYHHYTLGQEGGSISLANQFVIPQRAGKLQSQLKVIYEISLPHQALVRLTNSFGDMHLTDLSGEVLVSLEFGKLTLTNMQGKLKIQSSYADIEGRTLNTTLTVKAEHADITLEELGGIAQIQNQYGRLSVAPSASLGLLGVETTRTDIVILTKRLADFGFEVTTSSSTLSVPETLLSHLHKSGNKQSFSFQLGDHKPQIRIQSSYGPVTLQGEKPFVNK